jgi:hypothetical protein
MKEDEECFPHPQWLAIPMGLIVQLPVDFSDTSP